MTAENPRIAPSCLSDIMLLSTSRDLHWRSSRKAATSRREHTIAGRLPASVGMAEIDATLLTIDLGSKCGRADKTGSFRLIL